MWGTGILGGLLPSHMASSTPPTLPALGKSPLPHHTRYAPPSPVGPPHKCEFALVTSGSCLSPHHMSCGRAGSLPGFAGHTIPPASGGTLEAFLITALLRYNPRAGQFTYFECTVRRYLVHAPGRGTMIVVSSRTCSSAPKSSHSAIFPHPPP